MRKSTEAVRAAYDVGAVTRNEVMYAFAIALVCGIAGGLIAEGMVRAIMRG